MKVLNIVESAYRATLEEQDDTVIWLTHALRGAGAQVDVLLLGNSVNYAVHGQDASGLEFGRWKQTQPPQLERDLTSLIEKGAAVYVLAESLVERGLREAELVKGVEPVRLCDVSALLPRYARVWFW